MSITRIAFPLISSQAWMGGYNYMLNLISALNQYESARIKPLLFCGVDTSDAELKPFVNIEGLQIIKHQAFSNSHQTKGLLQALLLGKNLQVSKVFSEANIGVVFEPARFYGWRLKQSAIAWFPDFQHRHMPELFGRISWLKRELGFKMQIWAGRTILLSSNDAKQDCIKFYRINNNRMQVLKFPTVIPEHLLDVEYATLKESYQLPEKFIYVPNQFWLHKNHEVLIDALGILKAQGKDVTIICTGNIKDSRSSEHFSLLKKKIAKYKLENNFRILGLIPREHALGLLRACTLLINPSLFEGWNTSVEEAKAFNVPMILSNISVHQEQAGGKASYFPPDNSEVVASLLYDNIQQLTAPSSLRELDQSTGALNKVKKFASEFADLSARYKKEY